MPVDNSALLWQYRGMLGETQKQFSLTRAAATVTDSDATLSALPTGKTVKVRVTALNDAGESAPSAEVEAGVG